MITINKERLLKEFHEQGAIGWIDGEGLFRPSYSKEYYRARDFVKEKMEEAGLSTHVDSVGNLFGKLEGAQKRNRTILLGSHLDSVNGGGYYDGALGIMGGLEAIRGIKEEGIQPRHSLEVAAFIAEEGSNLGGTFGSRSFIGGFENYPQEDILKGYGLNRNIIEKAKIDKNNYAAFFELHVEQGPVLWKEKVSVGIPTHIVGITRYLVTIFGESNHAGTTPMQNRKDALFEGSKIIYKWLDFMRKQSGIVGNVGVLNLFPGEIGVVPGKMEIRFEIRSDNKDKVNLSVGKIYELSKDLIDCKAVIELWNEKDSVAMDESIIQHIENACRQYGFSYKRMLSWASHDANPIARVIPTGMIFVPSCRGLSHSKEEFSEDDDIVKGVQVLANAIVDLDMKI